MRMTKKQILELQSKQEKIKNEILKILCGENFMKSLDIKFTEDGAEVNFSVIHKEKIT